VLLVGAEGADLLHEQRKERLRRAGAVPAEGVHETLFAELLPGVVEGFRDPVGVEGVSTNSLRRPSLMRTARRASHDDRRQSGGPLYDRNPRDTRPGRTSGPE
jgi:hypothetical protein